MRKFLNLTASDRQLLVKAMLLLAMIRLGLWLLPFQTCRQLLAKLKSLPVKLPSEQVSVNQVVWAVKIVSRKIPGTKCLARALATQILLQRYGHNADLRIGVSKGMQGLEAHAWVESQGKVVIGGLKDLGRYTTLPTLEVTTSS